MPRKVQFQLTVTGEVEVADDTHAAAVETVESELCLGELLESVDLSDYNDGAIVKVIKTWPA